MSVRHLTASRRRQRKEQLARRHGARCTYCRRPFTSLREATIDHIAPHSLFPTWSVVHLTLACEPCNHTKADRLPLSIALLLAWSTGPASTGVHPTGTGATAAVTRSPGGPGCDLPGVGPDRSPDRSPGRLFTGDGSVFTGPDRSTRPDPTRLGPGDVKWLLLARLVHARSSAEQSTPEQAKHCKSVRRAVRVGRVEHQRRKPRMNACEQSTDRGGSA
ncbi:HNH endonuclease [Streptomyces sp. NBC_01238]|uniref:HNH endonuclease n=1 Tax=Streptomyces sp. NBC_01238 TaxID=2903791 RepID=UPI00386E2378